MYYARQGIVTEEMHVIARRKDLLRSWFAPKWAAAG
jgi:thiamine biosynthesis protein ThiC